ncbi:MAG: ABC transporter substrate-binding protein [Calditrichia bacterium]
MKKVVSVQLCILVLLLFGCGQEVDMSQQRTVDKTNTFQTKHARGFTILKQNDLDIIRIYNPWNDHAIYFDYLLIPAGDTIPGTLKHNQITIQLPIESSVLISTSHAGLFNALNCKNVISGFSNPDFLYDAELRQSVADERVKRTGALESLNIELLLDMNCDLLMMSGTATLPPVFKQLRDLNIPVFLNLDWMEQTPLGRAEWIRAVGRLVGKAALADSLFEEIETSYLWLAERVKEIEVSPDVFIGNNYRGTWYMPGGNSYVARLLKDAGAAYYWSEDSSSGSLPLSFETVLETQLNTSFWLQPGIHRSLASLKSEDERYANLTAFQSGNVFNSTARTNSTGSSDYWESGLINPHILLHDIVKILHPQLVPNHTFVFYERLSAD